MKTPIITVENISKKYILKHQNSERYTALRDVITKRAESIFNSKARISNPDSEEFWALKDISFEVNQGDRVGVIGRNGAGKSTLLKILSRIVKPTKGCITINGYVVSLLEVGTGFHPELTGRENIFLNGSILGMSRAEIQRKFDEIVAFAGVEKFLDTPVKRFSSGMYVRLAFSVAANLDSDILIVDEVLAVGDAEFQKKCLSKMEDVSGEGRTVLFVSHNISAIQKLCNQGILLQNGKIRTSGTIENVIATYIEDSNNNPTEYHFSKVGDNIAYVTKFTIENLSGMQLSEFPIGKAWRGVINFTVTRKVNGLVIALGMINSLEIPLRTSWTLPQELLPGNYKAVFVEDKITFSPGRYRLVLGLSIGGTQNIQYIDKDIYMHISLAIENQESSVVKNDQGILLNQMKMYIEKVELS